MRCGGLRGRFRALLEGESEAELGKLRQLARGGLCEAPELRAAVWRALLDPGRGRWARWAAEYGTGRTTASGAEDALGQRVRKELRRGARRGWWTPQTPDSGAAATALAAERVVRVVAVWAAGEGREWGPFEEQWVPLAALLAQVMEEESEVYCAFCAFMRKLRPVARGEELKRWTAHFLMLMQNMVGEVWSRLVSDEELSFDTEAWVVSWMQGLLATQLPTKCLLRLWDSYLSESLGFNLHPFVCLAIISYMQDDLIEADAEGVRAYLTRLPHMDMTGIIANAFNLRDDSIGKGLIPNNHDFTWEGQSVSA